MKKFFYLMSLCLCMFAGVAVMSSCGSDDDVEIDSGIGQKDVKQETLVTEGQFAHSGVHVFVICIRAGDFAVHEIDAAHFSGETVEIFLILVAGIVLERILGRNLATEIVIAQIRA